MPELPTPEGGDPFAAFLAGRASTLLMDAAMGTRLIARGLRPGDCGPAWNLSRQREVSRIHAADLAAGAGVLLANTFLSDPVSLARHGLADRLDEINAAAVRLARQAPGRRRVVLGDIAPLHSPGRAGEFTDLDALRRTVLSLLDADGLLFETCSSPAALSAVAFVTHRIPEADGLPLLLSLTYHRIDGELQTISGHRPESFARLAARNGVAALGGNCGRDIGPADVAEILCRYRAETDLPLFARPNAGTPLPDGTHPLSPAALADAVAALLAAGAGMIGGCCGTTEAHLAAVRDRLAG